MPNATERLRRALASEGIDYNVTTDRHSPATQRRIAELQQQYLGRTTFNPPAPPAPPAPTNTQQAEFPSYDDIMRDIRRMVAPRPPAVNFDAVLREAQASLAPFAESAQKQLEQQHRQAMRALEAQQAMAGVGGSPAQRAMSQLSGQHAQAIQDLQSRLTAQAAEQALGIIGAQTDRYRTQSQAEQAAMQMAQNIYSTLMQGHLAQSQQSADMLMNMFNLQEQARQANLPYQYPLAGQTDQQMLELFLQLLQGQQMGMLGGW